MFDFKCFALIICKTVHTFHWNWKYLDVLSIKKYYVIEGKIHEVVYWDERSLDILSSHFFDVSSPKLIEVDDSAIKCKNLLFMQIYLSDIFCTLHSEKNRAKTIIVGMSPWLLIP